MFEFVNQFCHVLVSVQQSLENILMRGIHFHCIKKSFSKRVL